MSKAAPETTDYPQYFHWSRHPFAIHFDYRFLFQSPNIKRALEVLDYAVSSDQWAIITGESGVGKSTLVRAFRTDVVDQPVSVTVIDSCGDNENSFEQFLRSNDLAVGDGSITIEASVTRRFILERINLIGDYVFVWDHFSLRDEAMRHKLMRLREITADIPLFHLFIVLDTVEDGAALHEELMQVVQPSANLATRRAPGVLRCHLEPLTASETEQYVSFRLAVAGWQRTPNITRDAWREIFGTTAGKPLIIHEQMNKIMQSAADNKTKLLDGDWVRRVINDQPIIESDPPATDQPVVVEPN